MPRPTHCPYCGTKLPRVSDPYCSECRGDLENIDVDEIRIERQIEADGKSNKVAALAILFLIIVIVGGILRSLIGSAL